MLVPTTLLSLGLVALLTPRAATAQEVECWAPDGETLADNTTYVPCNKLGITQEGVYSSCCNLDGKPGERDLCTTTGLCLNGGVLSRGYCTDQSWDSAACVNVCTDEASNGSQNGTVEITPCGDGTYCCGSNNLRCCDTDEAFTIPTQSSVITDNVTETVIVTHTASADDESSTFRNATIGLGAALGVVALVGLGSVLWLLRKNKHLYQQLAQAQSDQQNSPYGHHHGASTGGGAMSQMTPGSYSAHPYQESYINGETAGSAMTSPNPQRGSFLSKPPMSPTSVTGRGTPGAPSEIDGQRYSELDATMGGGDRGHLVTSPPLREEPESAVDPDQQMRYGSALP